VNGNQDILKWGEIMRICRKQVYSKRLTKEVLLSKVISTKERNLNYQSGSGIEGSWSHWRKNSRMDT
jgi:hypothetical protein